MGKSGLRINGGIGFAIANPVMELNVQESPAFQFSDQRDTFLDAGQQSRLEQKLNEIQKEFDFRHNIEVRVTGSGPIHSGFGSGTAVRLACIEALLILNDHKYSIEDVVRLSGRGGTSGIGIRTYFQGGYIFDIGHRYKGQNILPSSANESNTVQSLLINEGPMPDWPIGVCFPRKSIPNKESEADFFLNNTILNDRDVQETLYYTVYGVLAGIKEADFSAFSVGIKSLQTCAWKSAERKLYNGVIEESENILYSNGATCVGMSSLGPGLFFFGSDLSKIIANSQKLMTDWIFLKTKMNGTGRILTLCNA